MSGSAYINGKYIDSKKAAVGITSPGFLYGDGVFETLRTCSGRIINFDEHLDRLFSSLNELKYNPLFDRSYIKTRAIELVKKNRLHRCDAAVKIIVYRRNYTEKFRFDLRTSPGIIITVKKLENYPPEFYKRGIRIINSSIKRNPSGNLLYRHKLLNYFENIYAKNEAYAHGAEEALFTTRDKAVLECASSNIFIIKNNRIITPPLTQNILPGITRQKVIDLCRKNSIGLSQRKVHYFQLMEADEIFITNSIMGIMPVGMVDFDKTPGCKIPGIMTEMVSVLYRKNCF